MGYNVELSENFRKEAKKLIKKYPSLTIELAQLFGQLEDEPTMGIHLGNDVYKIRLAIASKNTGKSGGASKYECILNRVLHRFLDLFCRV